jgi:hypothetical protein
MGELDFFFDAPIAMQKSLLGFKLPGIWSQPARDQENRLRMFLAGQILGPYREKIARGLLAVTHLDGIIPDSYDQFRPVVRDGVIFFLARFPEERLKELILRQMLFPPDVEPGRRLNALVNRIPVLFKLGQMVARNPHFSTEAKAWLMRLEDEISPDEPDEPDEFDDFDDSDDFFDPENPETRETLDRLENPLEHEDLESLEDAKTNETAETLETAKAIEAAEAIETAEAIESVDAIEGREECGGRMERIPEKRFVLDQPAFRAKSQSCPAASTGFETSAFMGSFEETPSFREGTCREEPMEPDEFLSPVESGTEASPSWSPSVPGRLAETPADSTGMGLVPNCALQYTGELLGAGSVGWTVGAIQKTGSGSAGLPAVVKRLRPHVRKYFHRELEILAELGEYLEANRARYGLREFPFRRVFAEIREGLAREVDFPGEQAHLREAQAQYARLKSFRVPEVLPLSRENRTVMTRMTGESLKRIHLSEARRRDAARLVFHGFILTPLSGTGSKTIFHGDPHAGNFLLEDGDELVMSLLDWSQAGHLHAGQRRSIWQVVLGIAAREPTRVFRHLTLLADTPAVLHRRAGNVFDFIRRLDQLGDGIPRYLLGKACVLIDEMCSLGVGFPFELLVFRKALFTVEGVVRDLDPDFAFDCEVVRAVGLMLASELPERWWRGFVPLLDRSGVYGSTLTNRDVSWFGQEALRRLGSELLRSCANTT